MTDRSATPVYGFGTFRLFPGTGVLQDDGRDVRLGSRAVELLTALVERRGQVAPTDELIARVWPATTVDPQNLRVQIAGLRKALSDGHGDERFIATVPGSGYRFVAAVAADTPEAPRDRQPKLEGNLPAELSQLIGRADVIDDLRRRLAEERLVSIVGPGGVGKTSVAIAAARGARSDGVWFTDLAPVSDASLVPTALLETFGLAASPQNMAAALAHRLGGQKVLLVLDNCEHLVETCASTAEALLGAIKNLHVLATSREPLRATEEAVIRLPGLETPDIGASLESASGCAAVQLFVQRTASSSGGFSLSEETLPAVIDICRRLDGTPLALELAATAVRAFGVHGVAQRLREELDLPHLGRRTARPRQATLRATLEWSYQLLSPAEQRVLRRLAVFQGAFALESARAVAAPADPAEGSMLTLLASLAEKSLLSVDLSQEEARYRLLQTTRTFALERLTPREMSATRARHAREIRRLVEATDSAWGMGDSEQARRDSANLIDDLGAAIDWALSPLGDIETAVDLVVAATPLRRRLSLSTENAKQVERALEKVLALSPPNPGAEMRLLGSYGLWQNFRNESRDRIIAATERLQMLAEGLGDAEHLLVGFFSRAVCAFLVGDNTTFRRCGDQMVAAATPRTPETYRALALAVRSQIVLQDGDLAEARRAAESGLALLGDGSRLLHVARLGLDPGVYLYDTLVRICWAQGFPEQSLAAGRACVAHFRRLSHAPSLVYALTDVAAVSALLVGELDAAAAFLDESQRLCTERGERGFFGRPQEAMQAMLRFARAGTVEPATAAIVAPGSTDVLLAKQPALTVRIAEAIGASTSPGRGLAALDTVTGYVEANDWAQPELMRVRAALLWRAGTQTSEVEALLQHALGRARQIGALTLELRIATTLAELLLEVGKGAEALVMVTDVMDRISEGREATDYRRARALKERLSHS